MLTYDSVTKNKRESWALIGGFFILIIALGWFLSQYFGGPGFLYLGVGLSIAGSLISYYFSDSLTLAMSGAKQVDRQTAPELYRLVENLCITAGLPTPKIYIIEDTAPNAFATGRDPQHAAVCFTTGIVQKLDKTELEGVVAHELAHVGNYDIRVMTLVVVLVGTVTLLADWFLRASFLGGRRKNSGEGGSGAALAIFGLVLALLSPLVATIIKLAVSRKREYLADASAAMLTRYPEGLAKALEKIGSDREPLEAANKATAHLYIANPFHEDSRQPEAAPNSRNGQNWFSGLFNTHPPIEERVRRLRGMNL